MSDESTNEPINFSPPPPANPTSNQRRCATYIAAMVSELSERAEAGWVMTPSGKLWPCLNIMRDDGQMTSFPIPALPDA